jgi:hypothetical protein
LLKITAFMMLSWRKTTEPIVYVRPNIYFYMPPRLLYETLLNFALFELAKNFRTFIFYNKELKHRFLISEINAKKLNYHVT